jgi:replicative DNA helicase
VETGFKPFDYMTGGLRPGQLTIIAGRPAMGKSALDAQHVREHGPPRYPCFIFQPGDASQRAGCRVVLGRAETNIEVIRNGFLDHASKLRITEAADQFASEPLYVDDRGGLTMLDIRGRARLAVRRWGVRAIFVDYLQLVSHVGAQSRENEVGFVSSGLKGDEHGTRRSGHRRCPSQPQERRPQRQSPQDVRPPRER